ncbi:MAG: SusD/RagB family nutrient-binding outer membrane lipoprotein [Saprospiraceae bacterium]|nr:SusD/RagB family nutrient-binding outer membrane lipoprotein [Saprospiraceae bacterium]
MKNITRIVSVMIVALFLNSCSESLSDININPDKSPTANPQQVLTTSMATIGYVVDGQYNHDSFLWGQYWTWGPGVAISNVERYIGEAADYDNEWIRLYANALADLKFVSNSSSKAHAGIAKILMAHTFQGIVDHWGDVPFSEALNGELSDGSNFAPSFDDDAAIYPQLVTMVDDGMAEIASSTETVGGEDLMYGGDLDAWVRFGNSLKLRILLRMSDVNDVSQQVTDLMANGTFIESSSDMAAIPFAGNVGNENPMFARMEAGVKNFYIASNTSLDYLIDHSDPRVNAFYAPAKNSNSLVGILQGSIDEEPFTNSVADYSQMTAICYAADNPVILMSDWEVWFLRAEAALKFGGDDAAAFTNAVQASFDYLGVAPGTYITDLNYAGGSSAQKLDNIAIQKWISMNGLQEDEGWIETRRFDTPSNPLFSQNIFATPFVSVLAPNVHPSIWFYSSNELSLNPNAASQHSITDKVFWDK